jgi:hypothetical protein
MDIAVTDLKPGAKLSADVVDRGGRALLRAGAVLEAAQIRALKAWGIVEVTIEGSDATAVPTGADIDPALLQQLRTAEAPRFRHAALDHPFISALFEKILERKARTGGGHAP